MAGGCGIGAVGDVDDGHAEMRAVGRAECGAMVSTDRTILVAVASAVADTARALAVLKLGGLPVGAVALALTNQLQIAIEALEAGRAQIRWDLTLQGGFRFIAGTADGLRY